jgi:hypothetical protein
MFTSIIWSHSPTLISCNGDSGMIPALFTRTSTDPNFSSAKAVNAFTSSRRVTVEYLVIGCAPVFANFGEDFPKPICTAGAEEYLGAFAGEKADGGFTDAAARAGDEYNFVFDVCCHAVCRAIGIALSDARPAATF